ncbi:HAD-IIA family hydrolase [Virgibacillus sp. 179-BFC.A HS]|uniref:Acid sugar phosphatase n=1 Tax=Tigheibacillus jepli TaxID=3035914 RepID=A0ABU5CLN8_9BACI|nr:HAD-IIA family hydrolase [Virgibacillus sp. 179-BFC.A HS]MDY0406375.1 HAD-IIA family hydrolase [Virgibacillus sp. 179-BFC.A HS]
MGDKQIEAIIFDLDGTLYLGDHAIPGAVETLKWVRDNHLQVRFVTNNPRFSRRFYMEKLNRLQLQANLGEIVTSAQLTAKYLNEHADYGSVYVIGEEQLHKELAAANVDVVEHSQADTVLISFDTTVTYEKLMNAYHALKNGAHFIATNPDAVCPTPDGGLVDAGAIIAALETATGRKLEKVFGKPSKLLAELLIDQMQVTPQSCVVVGDRLNTDIQLGKQAKLQTVWIRAHEEAIPKETNRQPDFIIKTIKELPDVLAKAVGAGIG